MKISSLVLVIGLCVSVSQVRTAWAQNPYEKYLAGADVEKVTGMKGIRLIPRGSTPGAGGDLNFANAADELILMIQFTDAKSFESFKGRYVKGAVAGVGDQAVRGATMPGVPDNLLAFTKGNRCVVLTALVDFIKNRAYLTADQLAALGKLTASRL